MLSAAGGYSRGAEPTWLRLQRGHMAAHRPRLTLSALPIAMLLVGCGASGTTDSSGTSTGPSSDSGSQSSVPDSSSTSSASDPTTPPASPPAPIALAGTGQQATQPFRVTDGLTVLTAKCQCSGNFSAELLDPSGQTKDVAFNAIGSFSGSKGENLSAGSYTLKIGADAAWTVQITQPRGVAGDSLPHTYSGQGQQIVGPFAADASVRLEAKNAATNGGNFAIEVLDSQGVAGDVAVNEIGNYSGSTVSNSLSGGPYYLNIDSDGTWSASVSTP